MNDEDTDRTESSPQAGVLGNLPRTRPSVRSPRRRTEPPERAAERADSRGAEPPSDPEPSAEHPADLEALARTGLTVAGGAASLGLRLAGRAASAIRDAVERR